MTDKPHSQNRHGPLPLTWFKRGALLVAVLAIVLLVFSIQGAAAAVATLTVQEYGTGTPITEYQWLINEDNAGFYDPQNPEDTSTWPSLNPMPSHSPVVATGDQSTPLPDLTEGRYLITVRNDGYKLGGTHFSGGDTAILVELAPEPLPLSSIKIHAFLDNAPVNGEDDIPREQGLGGFRVILEDTAGEVVVDWFGNPICAQYDNQGDYIPGTGGLCMTDENGDLSIDNLPRGKYEVLVLPPAGQVSDWVQTTTIEGTKIIDAWIMEGDEGFSPREGFQQAAVWVGFVPSNYSAWDGTSSGSIMGTVRTIVEWTPPTVVPALGPAVDRPWIAVTDLGNDELVYMARGNPDGSFAINGVPDGTYQLAIWDEPLDYIIAFYTVVISSGNSIDMGDVGIARWFGWSSGHVFLDQGSGDPANDRNGYWDADEVTLPGVELLMRFRDGSIRYGTFTDNSGYYEFPEVFELEKFYITEVGFSHLGFSGAAVHDEFVGDPGSAVYDPANAPIIAQYPDALTVANLNWAAKRNVVDWGKYNYAPGENGGISGIVQYATTRNEFEARLQATEDYEPGIPGVTVNLYDANPNFDPTAMPGDPNSDPRLDYDGDPLDGVTPRDSVATDQYEHPTDCDIRDANGALLPDLDPPGLGINCIEVPNISNEVKEGLFDGGYAFADLTPGDYVVEVIPPTGYKIVTEADLNTADGNDLVPAIPPAGCVGDLTFMDVPDDYGSPYDMQYMPLCNRKGVTLQEGQNKGVDFYLMTDNAVPPPGRMFGFLLDDLNVETDPSKIYYGEKRGVPFTPVGVYDFTGRLITTIRSDGNGIWSVLLPSTYVADCPIPSGVCPNVYRFVGNDPGTPENPNLDYNPNYQTIAFQFDVWPGKTTFADVALFPITAFTEFPPGQFFQLPACQLPETTPQVFTVSPPYGGDGTEIVIEGAGFGDTPGNVVVGGVNLPAIAASNWSSTTITATVTGVPPGPKQLLVESAGGESSLTGITFHRLQRTGPNRYYPDIVTVPSDYATIQAAIDDVGNRDTVVVVAPGVYFDAVNLNNGSVKLQGYGPGDPSLGSPTGGGTILDQRFVVGGPNGLNVTGVDTNFQQAFNVQIDGFRIVNARDEQDIGGGLHVDQAASFLEIGNNVIQSNGGNFGGGITLGEPYRANSGNHDIRIHHNRVLNNGGISLAGGIGIFNDAGTYEIDHNQICGNYSGEYGGGISHFGLSRQGQKSSSIHHNQIVFNAAFDEGGGVIIAGELPIPPAIQTDGSGPVDIYSNLIQGNLSNDDGGGIRLLQPWDYEINIFNNMVVNNVSTDMGGGISLDDASEVTIFNNTVARNANTSTAEDSDGLAHSAGVVSELYSPNFQAYLGVVGGFPDPVMFNNAICENQAYTWDGVALNFDSFIDLEVFPGPGQLDPRESLLTDPTGYDVSNGACGDLGTLFTSPYETVLDAVAFRMEPNFVSVVIVSVDAPATQVGDYHLAGGPAIDAGVAAFSGVAAPADDIDGDPRPLGPTWDIGADEAQ